MGTPLGGSSSGQLRQVVVTSLRELLWEEVVWALAPGSFAKNESYDVNWEDCRDFAAEIQELTLDGASALEFFGVSSRALRFRES